VPKETLDICLETFKQHNRGLVSRYYLADDRGDHRGWGGHPGRRGMRHRGWVGYLIAPTHCEGTNISRKNIIQRVLKKV